jgi:hypothetical protein
MAKSSKEEMEVLRTVLAENEAEIARLTNLMAEMKRRRESLENSLESSAHESEFLTVNALHQML